MRVSERRRVLGETANDRLNLVIIRGLLGLGYVLVLAIAAIYIESKAIPPELLMIVSGVIAGLTGFLGKGQEHKAGISTGNVENVNVEPSDTTDPETTTTTPDTDTKPNLLN